MGLLQEVFFAHITRHTSEIALSRPFMRRFDHLNLTQTIKILHWLKNVNSRRHYKKVGQLFYFAIIN